VLFTESGRMCVTYLRRYIEIGHARAGVPRLTAPQRAALDAFDAVLDDPTVGLEDTLREGEMAIIDNRHVLHGRTSFVDNEDPARRRLLYRMWLRRRT
jgi:alpha-ketoglutarate-dependent taurine dioxygenase